MLSRSWWLIIAMIEGAFVLFLENGGGFRRLGRGPLMIEIIEGSA